MQTKQDIKQCIIWRGRRHQIDYGSAFSQCFDITDKYVLCCQIKTSIRGFEAQADNRDLQFIIAT